MHRPPILINKQKIIALFNFGHIDSSQDASFDLLHNRTLGLVTMVFGSPLLRCISRGKNWGKIGERIIGFSPVTKSFLLFGSIN